MSKKNILLFVLVPIVSIIVAGLSYLGYRYVTLGSDEVFTTNVTSNSFSIVWTSGSERIGNIALVEGESGTPVKFSAGDLKFIDDRDVRRAELQIADTSDSEVSISEISVEDIEQTEFKSHHVTASDLKPETTYTVYLGDGTIYKKLDTVETFAVQDNLSAPEPAYGYNMLFDEELNDFALSTDVVTVIEYTAEDGSHSGFVSSPAAENGTWNIDLATATYKSDGSAVNMEDFKGRYFMKVQSIHDSEVSSEKMNLSFDLKAPYKDILLGGPDGYREAVQEESVQSQVSALTSIQERTPLYSSATLAANNDVLGATDDPACNDDPSTNDDCVGVTCGYGGECDPGCNDDPGQGIAYLCECPNGMVRDSTGCTAADAVDGNNQPNPCENVECGNNGRCVPEGETFKCWCPGYGAEPGELCGNGSSNEEEQQGSDATVCRGTSPNDPDCYYKKHGPTNLYVDVSNNRYKCISQGNGICSKVSLGQQPGVNDTSNQENNQNQDSTTSQSQVSCCKSSRSSEIEYALPNSDGTCPNYFIEMSSEVDSQLCSRLINQSSAETTEAVDTPATVVNNSDTASQSDDDIDEILDGCTTVNVENIVHNGQEVPFASDGCVVDTCPYLDFSIIRDVNNLNGCFNAQSYFDQEKFEVIGVIDGCTDIYNGVGEGGGVRYNYNKNSPCKAFRCEGTTDNNDAKYAIGKRAIDNEVRTRFEVCTAARENGTLGVTDSVLGISDSITYDPDQGIFFLDGADDGILTFTLDGQEYEARIYEGIDSVRIYIDENENGQLDTDERVVSTNPAELNLVESKKIERLSLKQGFNLVNIPLVLDQNYDTAAELLQFIDSEAQGSVTQIAQFDGGWKPVGLNLNQYDPNNFNLVPGKGYLVKANQDLTLELEGYAVSYEDADDQAPVALRPGWNLMGLYGTGTASYTAESLIDDINSYSEGSTDFNANNLTRFQSETQRYEGIQKEADESGQEQVYGFDFPLNQTSGYFLRVTEGSGIWEPSLE